MRTKALLCLAAVAASAVTAMAQSNVYSLNIVGYVNVPVEANKFYMLGNPLNVTAGNAISNVIKLDDSWEGTTVYPWTSTGYGDAEGYYAGAGWFPGTTDISPGKGFFLQPNKSGTITFVGEVVTGNTNTLPGGFTLTASAYPAALSLAALGLPGITEGDTVYRFDPTTGYKPSVGYYANYGWFDAAFGDGGPVAGPALGVGEAFFYLNAGTAFQWKQNFTVQ